MSGGHHCDGYRTSPPLQQSEHDWLSKPHDPIVAVITPERALVSFVASEQERRSFDFYRDRTASALAHTLDSTFWTEFILQISHSEPAVRHALVAIGALNERLRSSTGELSLSNQDRSLKLALSSYNKAIKHLTKQMQHGESDLIALLTCILFICVEFLQDNIAEALTLVHQGCAILRGQQTLTDQKDEDHKSQSQQVMIDHQVMPMFSRLTVLSALCGRPATLNIAEVDSQVDSFQFTDLRGARSLLYVLMEQGHAIIRKADACKWAEGENSALESLRVEHSTLRAKLGLWHYRFTQLQTDLELLRSTRLIQAVSLLSMYFTTTSIWHATCLERAQISYDVHRPQFKQILEAAELYINLSEGQPQSEILFTFEMGLVPPLYFTAARCRFPALRRRAVALMRRAPGKEGMWDRAEMVGIADKVIGMEEGKGMDFMDENCVPDEAARFHDVEFVREEGRPGQRKTVAKYWSKPDGLDSPWLVTEELFGA